MAKKKNDPWAGVVWTTTPQPGDEILQSLPGRRGYGYKGGRTGSPGASPIAVRRGAVIPDRYSVATKPAKTRPAAARRTAKSMTPGGIRAEGIRIGQLAHSATSHPLPPEVLQTAKETRKIAAPGMDRLLGPRPSGNRIKKLLEDTKNQQKSYIPRGGSHRTPEGNLSPYSPDGFVPSSLPMEIQALRDQRDTITSGSPPMMPQFGVGNLLSHPGRKPYTKVDPRVSPVMGRNSSSSENIQKALGIATDLMFSVGAAPKPKVRPKIRKSRKKVDQINWDEKAKDVGTSGKIPKHRMRGVSPSRLKRPQGKRPYRPIGRRIDSATARKNRLKAHQERLRQATLEAGSVLERKRGRPRFSGPNPVTD